LTNSFTDQTAASTVTIVEAITLVTSSECPASFTISQYIKAGGRQFGAVQAVAIPAVGQVVQVTFGYAGLPHSALRTLGPTFELVNILFSRANYQSEDWVGTLGFTGGGDTL